MADWDYIYDAKGKGACCTQILVSLQGQCIRAVKIAGGCSGNHTGIEKLVAGCNAHEIIGKFLGTECRNGTSCPDQLAKALQAAIAAAPAPKPE